MKIEKLTDAQKALLPDIREKWIQQGLSTEPANRAEAERGVRLAYKAAGLEPPRFIIWVDSPYSGAFAQAIAPSIIEQALKAVGQPAHVGDHVRAQVWDHVRAQVGAHVWDQVGDQVGAQVWDQVWDQVRDQVRDHVRAHVRAHVGAHVWDQVGDQVGAQVWDQVWDQVRDHVRDHVGAHVRAQVGDHVRAQVGAHVWDHVRDQVGAQVWDHVWDQVRAQVRAWTQPVVEDYYTIIWSSWIDAMRQLGVEGLGPWEGHEIIGKNAYWWWAFKHFVVMSERPNRILRDAEGRLHSETGQAITWPDGWGFSVWHGTRVPDWVITDPDSGRALKEPNSEVRRAAFERIGWDKAVKDLGLQPISTAADPANFPNELELYSLPERVYEQPVNLLLMVNGSPDRSGTVRRYGETVPARITDALGAAAWQYGVSKDLYARLERRT